MAELNYEVKEKEGESDTIALALHGELDMSVASDLRTVLQEQLAGRPSRLVIDMAEVPFIDSSIIATLVGGLKLAREGGGEIKITNCQEAVRDTFEITRLLESFGID